MILMSALTWMVSAIAWLLAPLWDIFGLYALIGGAALVLAYCGWRAMWLVGRAAKRRAKPT